MSTPTAIPAEEERETATRRWGWLAAQVVILILAGFFVFAPALHGAWTWDDKPLIANNPIMADPGGWWKLWFAPVGPEYLPLSSTIEWMLWQIFGDNTLPFHLVSLLLHVLSALLLWQLFARLGLRLAWFGALIFVVHPLSVMSVAWISELKNTTSLPLLLMSMLCWLRYDEHERSADFAASLGCFLAAMLAKTSVVMLPLVLLLYTWWKHGRITRQQLIRLWPFFVISLVLGLITVGFQVQWGMGGGEQPMTIAPFPARIASAGWAILFYLGKFLWPLGLHPIYLPWSFSDLTMGQFLPWPLLLVVLGWMGWRRKTWGRPLLFGFGFFLLNVAPVLGFLPMAFQRFAWVSDHFVYLPMIGLIGLAIGGLELALEALPQKSARPFAWTALAALVPVFAWQSRTYAQSFRSELALFTYARQVYPASHIAEYNLAFALVNSGHVRESIPEFKASLETDPDNYTTENDLGTAYSMLGDSEQAIAHYTRSLKLKPSAETYFSLGLVLVKRQQFAEAIGQFESALRLKHNFPEAELNLGNAEVATGHLPQALAAYQAAIRLKPDYSQAYFDLGAVLAAVGRTDEAIQAYETALRINPQDQTAQAALDRLRHAPIAPALTPTLSP